MNKTEAAGGSGESLYPGCSIFEREYEENTGADRYAGSYHYNLANTRILLMASSGEKWKACCMIF